MTEQPMAKVSFKMLLVLSDLLTVYKYELVVFLPLKSLGLPSVSSTSPVA